MKKFLVALLLCCSSSLAYGQEVSTTDNIIVTTDWNNVIYMTQGQLQQVEGSGGGPEPAYNTSTNTIRFSYFPYTVSQIIAINSVLQDQGIQITGYNYSWQIMNDLYNCCGTRGYLTGRVYLTDSNKDLLEQYYYDYSNTNTGGGFLLFSGTQDFNTSYSTTSLGNLGVEFTGSDMNFWSGYYGPRVRDVQLSLNYTVSSTIIDPIVEPITVTIVEEPVQEPIAQTSEPVIESAPTVTTAIVQQTTENSSEPIVATTTSTTSSVASSTEKTVTIDSMAVARNIFRRDSELATSIVNSSIESSSILVGSEAISENIASSDGTSISSSLSQKTNSLESMVVQQSIAQSTNEQSTTTQAITNPQALAAFASNNTTYSESMEQSEIVSSSISENAAVELVDNKSNNVVETAIAADETNPTSVRSLAAMNNIKPNNFEEQEQQERQRVSEIVSNSVTPNELAGSGVEIAAMQVVPVGYNTYLNLTLRDTAFYAPKEIYRNQTVIDNAPAQRLLHLASDVKFEEMISQQYGER